MMAATLPVSAEPGTAPARDGHFRRVLGLPTLVLLGLVYMVPLTIFTTYGIVTQLTGGRLPVAYVLTLLVMLFTARSYGKMAAAIPVSGSAYAYVSNSFGPAIGFLAGWSLMLDYMFLPMINYLVIGIFLGAALPMVPTWVIVVASIGLVTAVNLAGITSIARANIAIVGVQAVFIVVFAVLAVVQLTGSGTVDPLAPFVGTGDAGIGGLLGGAAILCLSFLGFDAVSTFAEESRDARRMVPRAIMLTTLIAGGIFIGLAYLSYLVLPTATFTDVDAASLEVVARVGGSFLSVFFTAAYVAGSLGSALTSQASVSRIIHAMGRDGVLPRRVFGRLSGRGAPVAAILVTSAVALLALVMSLTTISSLISFGALVAFSMVNLSVIKHYAVDRGRRHSARDVLSFVLLPLVGFIATAWLWTSLSGLTLVVGLTWAAVGFGYLLVLTRGFRRPTPRLDLKEI
ncbi:MAG TPA: APC family permease [Microlunatus sp.]|nr:APC family permease [Microlunatus sp.]